MFLNVFARAFVHKKPHRRERALPPSFALFENLTERAQRAPRGERKEDVQNQYTTLFFIPIVTHTYILSVLITYTNNSSSTKQQRTTRHHARSFNRERRETSTASQKNPLQSFWNRGSSEN